MRNTKQKNLILNIINESKSHPTAQDIYEESRKIIPNISLGTVYRILNGLFLDKKIIKIKIDNIARYDNVNCIHDHFHCYNCLSIIDIFERKSLDLSGIGEHKVYNYSIIYKGICKECLKKER